MLLTGSFLRTLDEKQRLFLPKAIREAVGHPERNHLYMTPGTDRSLAVYTEEALVALGQQLERHSPTSADVRSFSRVFYARASRIEIDRQGRIRIPSELVALASIGSEAMLLGVRDHLEIWEPDAWQAFERRNLEQFDLLAERAFAPSVAQGSGGHQP